MIKLNSAFVAKQWMPIVLLGLMPMMPERAISEIKSPLIPLDTPLPPQLPSGYLPKASLPDSLKLLPPPPKPGSIAQEADDELSQASLAFQNTTRWKIAIEDADLRFPAAADAFSCSLGIQVSEGTTPRLYNLLSKTLIDAALSTYDAKNLYQRPRPFTVNGKELCTPTEQDALMKDGSYPSGHSTIGWAWALILSEVAPSQANVILARGRAFGDSRMICNVHWHSDVVEGRTMGASVVARLHSNADFLADLAAAAKEVESAQTKGLKPGRDCLEEALTLSNSPFF